MRSKEKVKEETKTNKPKNRTFKGYPKVVRVEGGEPDKQEQRISRKMLSQGS